MSLNVVVPLSVLTCLFDLLDGMQNSRMMSAIVEPSDLGRAPAADVLRKIHRNLTAEAGHSFIAGNSVWSEMSSYGRLDLLES